MTVTPNADAPSPEPVPEGRPAMPPGVQPVPDRTTWSPPRAGHLTIEEFRDAYALAVSTSDDPTLDGLLLQHLFSQAARPAELLSLRYGDLDLADATITVRDNRLYRARMQPSTPEHVAALVAHAAERGPRTPAPPNAPAELRRAGVPALAGDDPVFYRRPVDTFDAEGFLVARQVRPMTRRRLTSLTSRVRQHGGPALSASAVRALSIRLIRAAGGDAEAECGQCGRRNRRLFSGLPDRAAGDDPGSTSR